MRPSRRQKRTILALARLLASLDSQTRRERFWEPRKALGGFLGRLGHRHGLLGQRGRGTRPTRGAAASARRPPGRARRRSSARTRPWRPRPSGTRPASHSRRLSWRSGVSRICRTTSCGATVPFQRFSSRRKRTSWRTSRRARSAWRPSPNAIAEPAGRSRWRTRKRRCFPSAIVLDVREIAGREQQGHAGIPEAEGREVRELGRECERQLLARDDRVHRDRSAGGPPPGAPRRRPRRRPPRTRRAWRGRSKARRRHGARRTATDARSRRPARRGGRRTGSTCRTPSSRRRCPRSGRRAG